MKRSTLLRSLLAGGALGLVGVAAPAQPAAAWPTKPVRLIVPFPPGGGTDILARLVATQLGESKHWTIVADNRGGAGGTVGISEAVRAAPTGYDLVIGQKDNLVVAPWLYKNVNYDPTKDLVPLAHIAYTPVVIATRAESRFKTLADVVAASRATPGSVTYGSPGNGTTIHLAAEIFKKAAGIDIRHVPYKGSNPAMLDALAGNIDLLVSSVPSAMGQIKSGKLRALAVTSIKRSSSLPEVPTVAEQGYKGFDVSTWYGLFAPAGTPKNVVTAVHDEVNRLLGTPQFKAAIVGQGAEPLALGNDQFADLLKTEYQQWRTIVKDSGAVIE